MCANQDEGDLQLGKKAEVGVEERDSIVDLNGVVWRGDAADQDAVDGGSRVLEGVKDKLYVSVLWELVPQIGAATHGWVAQIHTTLTLIPIEENDCELPSGNMIVESAINCCGGSGTGSTCNDVVLSW